jgi:hypothetical protein
MAAWRLNGLHRLRGARFRRFQGLAHDDEHWYMTTRYGVLKLTPDYTVVAESGIPEELRRRSYNHLCAPESASGALFVPIEAHTPLGLRSRTQPAVVAFLTPDLSYDAGRSFELQDRATSPWCALHPADGLLYTSNFNDVDRVAGYKIGHDGAALRSITLVDPDGTRQAVQGVQGGCFLDATMFALTTHGSHELRVYSLEAERERAVEVSRLSIPYEPGRRSELEGIAHWPGRDGGELHVALLNRSWFGRGDVALHHVARG